MFDTLKMYWRFASGLGPFLNQRLSLEEARAIVAKRMAERGENFLRMVERGVFGYADSPYLPLMKLAGCEMGDLKNMIRDNGLDETLRELRRAGVYFSFEEFKGRQPVERQGRTIPLSPQAFDNPFLSRYYYLETSGSTGAGTRVAHDLDNMAARTCYDLLSYEALGLLGTPTIMWSGELPAGGAINLMLKQVQMGQLAKQWFTPLRPGDLRPALRFRLATRAIVLTARLMGVSFPYPKLVRLDQAEVIARLVAETLQKHGACLLRSYVSMDLRVSLAAQALGLDLTGATFLGGGEPATPSKVAGITASGARFVSSYATSELGAIGITCPHADEPGDMHFYQDIFALITYPRRVPNTDIDVDAVHFTTLLPTTPKIMLNVEADDFGVIETRSCGCLLETYGFTKHLSGVGSFQKLTGEGMTLIGGDMLRILEEVLPARFGGSALDYQLEEVEDQEGLTRLNLIISPKVRIDDESEVIAVWSEALKRVSVGADLARATWRQAGTLRIKRAEPVWSGRGKLMPLLLAERMARAQKETKKE